MATSKKIDFQAEEIILADFAKALSHPARIAILKILAEQKSCVCGELVSELPLAQSTISQHLKELKSAGLILGTVEGTKSCFCVNWAAMKEVASFFNLFFNKTQSFCDKENCC